LVTGVTALQVVLAAAWRRRPLAEVDDDVLASARALASRNLVEGPLLAAYPARFPASAHRRMATLAHLYRTNLAEVGRRLSASDVSAVLIKSGLETEPSPLVSLEALSPAAIEYGDFDLVVGPDGWDRSITALRPWGQPDAPHPLEPGKLMVQPRTGPGAHLHRRASWFGIPVISTARLRAGARREPALHGLRLPGPSDALRLWLAHAVFQNLAFDLSELLHVRALATPRTVAEAGREAAAEGWGRAFRRAFGVAAAAMDRLDRGEPVRLPVPLPVLPSLAEGLEHGGHLIRTRQWAVAVREVVQRPMLVAAKQRRQRSA
jgi:hypothetical protein